MLEADARPAAVAIAKLEEAHADHGPHERFLARNPGDLPDAGDLRVGDEEVLTIRRQSARLGEPGRIGRAIKDVLVSRPREHADGVRIEVEPPDLVRARHGDVEGPLARNLGDVPGTAQGRRLRRTAEGNGLHPGRLGPDARDRRDAMLLEIQGADRVVLGVGDVQDLAVKAHALGPVEPRFLVRTILETFLTVADHDRIGAFQVGLNDPVMAGVRDEQAIALSDPRGPCRGTEAGRSRGVPSPR